MADDPWIDRRVARAAERHAERTALVDSEGAALSFGELWRRSGRVAAFLGERGIGPGGRVGLALPKGLDSVCALLGTLRAGAAYVPVDVHGPEERARGILADCAVHLCFATPAFEDPPCETVRVPGPAWDALASRADAPGGPGPVQGRTPDDLAFVLYTSGSTGAPKGVMLSHRNALAFVDWAAGLLAPLPADRFTSHAPFHFDLSVLDLYVALAAGAEVHLVDAELGRNPRALAAFVGRRRPTVWYSTPTTLSLLAELGRLETVDASSLRAVLFAGEVFPVKRLRRLAELWPGPAYYNLYGPTETNVCTFARVPTPIPPERSAPFPIGQACAHCALRVLDAPGGAPVAAGEAGLLHVAGPSVFLGYFGRPAETAARVHARDGERWYDTGDVVRDAGAEGLIYLGRRDRMVKRRGYRIELDEIEAGLYRHPAVREAGVVARPDADQGCRIEAHLVVEGARPSIVELKGFCARVLPESMVPDRFHFAAELPRTSTHKVDYQRLAAS